MQDDASRYITVTATVEEGIAELERHFYAEKERALRSDSPLMRQLWAINNHNDDATLEDGQLRRAYGAGLMTSEEYRAARKIITSAAIEMRYAQVIFNDYRDQPYGPFGREVAVHVPELRQRGDQLVFDLPRFDGLPEPLTEMFTTCLVLDRLRKRGFYFAAAHISPYSDINTIWLRDGQIKVLNAWVNRALKEIDAHQKRGAK